jgi:hypothetical protein
MKTISRTSIALFTFLSIAIAADALAQSGPYSYYPLTPCRTVDTRNPNSTNGGPALGAGVTRNFQIKGTCGVPSTAKAASINVTITGASAPSSWLTIWPSGQPIPVVSTINFTNQDPALANGAIVGLSANALDLSVLNANGAVHVLIDVTGYFQ